MNDDGGDELDPREYAKKMDRIRQIMELESRSGGFDKVHPDVKDELRRLYFELTGHHLMIAPDGEDPEQSARRYFDTLNAMNEDRGPLQ
jgi:hypothetical protein